MNQPAEQFNLTPPESDHQQQAFFEAWKEAVELTGLLSFFGVHNDMDMERAKKKESLTPRLDIIRKKISDHPISRSAMVAAMVSFYNPAEGAKLEAKIQCSGLGCLAAHLNHKQRQCLSKLLLSYQGW